MRACQSSSPQSPQVMGNSGRCRRSKLKLPLLRAARLRRFQHHPLNRFEHPKDLCLVLRARIFFLPAPYLPDHPLQGSYPNRPDSEDPPIHPQGIAADDHLFREGKFGQFLHGIDQIPIRGNSQRHGDTGMVRLGRSAASCHEQILRVGRCPSIAGFRIHGWP
jgi:hypothetical protein